MGCGCAEDNDSHVSYEPRMRRRSNN